MNELEVINTTEENNMLYVDMVFNDHGVWDTLTDRQFRTLTDKIDSKDFNSYKMDFHIVVSQDPTGIVLTLVHNKGDKPKEVNNILNSTVKQIQNFLKGLTK